MNTMRKFTDREKDAVLRIYDHFLNYMEAVYEDLKYMVDNGVDSLICEELEAEGEFDEYIDSVCFDEETSEEEKEEILAKMEEDEESVFLAIYIGTMNYFQNIIDPYL